METTVFSRPRRGPRFRHAYGQLALSVLLLALAATTARAQECQCPAPLFPARWSVFVSTGASIVDPASINARITTVGYSTLSDGAVGVGLGGYGSFGPLRLGAEHVRLDAGDESTVGGRSARLEADLTTLTVGWDLLPRRRFSLVPTLGVGRGTLILTVGDRAGGATVPTTPPPIFQEIITTPGRWSRITGGQWIWEPMLAADFLVGRKFSDIGGITLGVRAGYRIAPNRPDWSYRGTAVSGGALTQAKGPMLRLTLGVGGR